MNRMRYVLLVQLVFIAIYGDILNEMEIITLDTDTYYLKAEYCEIKTSEFRMNGRCYSFSWNGNDYTEPISPGPTLKMITGSNPTIILQNDFYNSIPIDIGCHNSYCDLDTTNLHTHGLHITSTQDDVLIDLFPKANSSAVPTQHPYSYNVPSDHYPGIHWYHPHNHGSVSHQIHFGMFGALITEYPNSDNYADKKLYSDGGIDSYKITILVFSYIYAVDTNICINNCDEAKEANVSSEFDEGIGAYGRCILHGRDCFHIYSACFEYCSFDTHNTSGLQYNVSFVNDNNINGIEQYFLVNGQINPTITNITRGKYRRLLFVNTVSQYYIHYNLPNQCQFYLLGFDGVFFNNDEIRNLSIFQNELMLAPGSRADVLFKCDTVGEYEVTTVSDGETEQNGIIEQDLDGLERAGSDGTKTLFILKVETDGDDILDELPLHFPDKPEYLKDLREVNLYDTECPCNQYAASDLSDACNGTTCCIQYNSKDEYVVNGLEFEFSGKPNDYLTYMMQDMVYEYILKTDRHTHHQHAYPFQLQHDVGFNGFIGKSGDWFDTFGAEDSLIMRMYTADFSGYMVLHCHILPHEDEGMMAISYVISPDNTDNYINLTNEQTGDLCLVDLIENTLSVSPTTDPTQEPTQNPTMEPTQPTVVNEVEESSEDEFDYEDLWVLLKETISLDFANYKLCDWLLLSNIIIIITCICITCICCCRYCKKRRNSYSNVDQSDWTDTEEEDV